MPEIMMSEEDEKWQAKNDARTLAEADVIKSDTERLNAAGLAAKDMAEDQLQEALSMKKVANLYPSLAEGSV